MTRTADEKIRWQPSASIDVLRRVAALRRRIRDYFDANGVLEVATQALGRFAVTDPAIESLTVELMGGQRRRFLQTSPEFQMKRLLAAGAPDIYQLGSAFRDGEAGRRHQPEFTLLEWYRLGFGLDALIADTVALIEAALARKLPVTRLRYADALQKVLGRPLARCSDDELRAAAGADQPQGLDERDALLDWLLVTRVFPTFARNELTVLTHYPASQAALAQLDPDDLSVALRFEVFAGELELANGFVELTDADEQRRRFATDNAVRADRGQEHRDADTDFLAALAAGLPACAGVAVGVDRLVSIATGETDIRRVQPFPPVTE